MNDDLIQFEFSLHFQEESLHAICPVSLIPSIILATCLAFLPISSIYLFLESTSSSTTAGIITSLSSNEKIEYGSCNNTFVSNTYILLNLMPPAPMCFICCYALSFFIRIIVCLFFNGFSGYPLYITLFILYAELHILSPSEPFVKILFLFRMSHPFTLVYT